MPKYIELSNNIAINVLNITYIEVTGFHNIPTQYKIYFGHDEHYIIVSDKHDIDSIKYAMLTL